MSYGVTARNDCPVPVVNAAVAVRVLDVAGKELAGQDDELPDLVVMLAGQELAGAGNFYLQKTGEVGKVEVAFTSATPASAGAFAAWPREVRVTELAFGVPDSRGRSTISGRIVTDPAGAALCSPAAVLILRDRSGNIISGQPGVLRGNQVTFEFAVPAAADRSKSIAAVALGQPAIGVDPAVVAASAACAV